jgi:hypothetical protein
MLNYVTLIGTYPAAGYDGPIQDAPPLSGSVMFVPSAPLSSTAVHESFRAQPVAAELVNGQFTVELLATDNSTIAPEGWGWTITESIGDLPASQWSFFLPYTGGVTQYLDEITPTGDVIPLVAYMLVTGADMTGPLTLGAGLIIPAGAAAGLVWTSEDTSGAGAWQAVDADPAGAAAEAQEAAEAFAAETFVPLSLVGADSGVAPLDGSKLVPSANLPTASAETQGAILLPVPLTAGGTGATTAAGARTALGLGTAATQAASSFDAAGAAGDAQTAAEEYAAGLQPTAETPQALIVGGTGVSATSGTELLTELGAGSAAFEPTSAFDPAGAAGEAQEAAEAASLPLDGGTMTGPVNMGGNKITNAGDGSAAQDVVAFGQLGTAAFQSSSAFDAAGAAGNAQSAAQSFATTAVGAETTRALEAEALLAPLASPALTGTPTAPTPTGSPSATQLATVGYVMAIAQGLDTKPSVSALAAGNITLSGTQTVDGVALTAGMRCLAAGQSTASQNGLWVVAAGAWTRPADFASGSSQQGSFVFVEAGNTYGSSGWAMSGNAAVTVDATAETWTQFSGAGEIAAGTGLTKLGNTLSVTAGTFILLSAAGAAGGVATLGGGGTVPTSQLPTATTGAQGAVQFDGTATDIQPAGPQAAGSSGLAADAKHVHFASGMLLRAPTVYAPSPSAVNLTTTSATFSAISSGTVSTGSFTAPASGEVLVEVQLFIKNSASGNVAFALAAIGGISPLVGDSVQFTQGTSVTQVLLKFPVTSLTPGQSYNFDVLFAVTGSSTLTVTAFGQTATTITSGNAGGPAVITTVAV